MGYIAIVLDFLLLGTFLFWGVIGAGFWLLLALLNVDEDAPVHFMGVVLLAILGAVMYRNPEIYTYALANPLHILGGAFAYLIAGFPVSLMKWWNKIRRFKLEATIMKRKFLEILNSGKMRESGRVGYGNHGDNQDADPLIELTKPLSVDKPVPTMYVKTFNSYFTDNKYEIETKVGVKLRTTDKGGYVPDSDKSPVKTWWFFWPVTTISVVYEPAARFVIVWYERTRVIYRGMADRFGSTDSLVG